MAALRTTPVALFTPVAPRAGVTRAGRVFSLLASRHATATRPLSATSGRSTCRAAARLDALNAKFGIKGAVKFEAGQGGLTKAVLTHNDGSVLDLYLFGACATSWKLPNGGDVLFVRPDAVFDGKKPISGGVPHCFPQFGPGGPETVGLGGIPGIQMQQHGFARNLEWEVASSTADVNPNDPEPTVALRLVDNDYTRKMWDFPFEVIYEVKLSPKAIHTAFKVNNTGAKAFAFTTSLHTYIATLDVGMPSVNVRGLKGSKHIDRMLPGKPTAVVEDRAKITFGTKVVDSLYPGAAPVVGLEVGTGCTVNVENVRGYSDMVVWNPYETMKACYKDFVAVESAAVAEPVTVAPGGTWLGEMKIFVEDKVVA